MTEVVTTALPAHLFCASCAATSSAKSHSLGTRFLAGSRQHDELVLLATLRDRTRQHHELVLPLDLGLPGQALEPPHDTNPRIPRTIARTRVRSSAGSTAIARATSSTAAGN